MKILVQVKTSTPDPRMALMHKNAAPRFNKLRETVRAGSGIDFLAKCGDVLRPANFVSSKDGVANRSWHKTGRAFDYDQTSKALVIVSEIIGGKQFFRTWLICADQTGKQGVKKHLRDYRGGSTNSFVFDFSSAAAAAGFKRIPAWSGWQKNYNRREFWHYQFDEGLTWQAAMNQLKGGSVPASQLAIEAKIIGLNDRDSNTGGMVTKIQTILHQMALLPTSEIDGVFGHITKGTVKLFQESKGIPADGLVGPETRKLLGL